MTSRTALMAARRSTGRAARYCLTVAALLCIEERYHTGRLTGTRTCVKVGYMEVHLSSDKQARLQEIAARVGKSAEEMVQEAVDRMLEYDERFAGAVEEGRNSARRGELLEHDDVVARIEKRLRS